MSLRNRELLNLLAVGVLTVIGFASVYIARQAVVSTASLSYAAFFLALYLVAHLVVRKALPNADPYLLPIAGLLTAIGLTLIYRIDPSRALRQGLWVVVGLALFAALVLFLGDYRRLDAVKYTLALAAIGLLVLPALPGIGATINGASLWVRIGPIAFQPGEFAKVLLVIFLAGYLRDNRELLSSRIPSPKHFGPLLLIWGGAMLVLFQTNDLGGGLLYFAVFLAMLYVATGRWPYVVAGTGLFAVGAYGLYQVVPRVASRVSVWLDPWSDPSGEGYQLAQSLYAISGGGLFGSGLGRGVLVAPRVASRVSIWLDPWSDPSGDGYQLAQSLYAISGGGLFGSGLGRGVLVAPGGSTYIPFLETDFIYSAIAQELGLAGAAALILLYVLFVYRGLRIAMLADDGFSKLLATGLTAALGIQAFIIIGGVSGLIPLTGITLPFVSYGGSSIVANTLLLGLLLMVSNRVNRKLL